MDPIITFSGLNITLAELMLGILLFVLGVLITLLFASKNSKILRAHLSDMVERQSGMQGRLSQFAEDAARREEKLRQSLDARLDQVSHKVGRSLSDNQERSSQNLKALHERLALIDRAQKNIETLANEVSGLQNILSNKQARGAFGEKQMQDLIENFLPPNAYSFQVTLSNAKKVDALIHLPGDQGHVAVDSKFPLESWNRLMTAENQADKISAARDFRRDVSKHINDIAGKYLIFGETYEIALLFLPSEAIYAELHTNFTDLVEKGFSQKVMIVSPTTFMATLHTMRAVMKDAAMREHAHVIQKEVGVLAEDVRRLTERAQKLQSHFGMANKDITDILTSTAKISSRSDRIGKLDLSEDEVEHLDDERGEPNT
jgi:DNA recombination protein RmuC